MVQFLEMPSIRGEGIVSDVVTNYGSEIDCASYPVALFFSCAKPRESPRWWQWSKTFAYLGPKNSAQIQQTTVLLRFDTYCPKYIGKRFFALYTSRAISCSFLIKFAMQFSELSITFFLVSKNRSQSKSEQSRRVCVIRYFQLKMRPD